MVQYLIADPPSGWAYGFPKAVAEVPDNWDLSKPFPIFDYEGILKDAGYPEKDINMALNHSRYWVDSL